MFLTERKKYKTKSIRLRLKKLICFIFLLLFSKSHGFIEEDKPSENVVIVEEELNRFDIDGIEILENLPEFVLSIRNVGISRQSMVMKSLVEILTKRRSWTFHK